MWLVINRSTMEAEKKRENEYRKSHRQSFTQGAKHPGQSERPRGLGSALYYCEGLPGLLSF